MDAGVDGPASARADSLAPHLSLSVTVKARDPLVMEMIAISPERKAQLEKYAQRHGQDAVSALDEVLCTYFEWERVDFEATVQGIERGYEDVRASRTRPAESFLDEIQKKHGIPRRDHRGG